MTTGESLPRRAVRAMRLPTVSIALIAAFLSLPASAAASLQRPLYLALGDSVAVGVGAPHRDEGYVHELHDLLTASVPCGGGQALGCGLDLLNIAEPGATTATLAAGQLPRAITLIAQRRATATPIDDVRLITLDIGGSDVFTPILQACSADPQTPECATVISTVLDAFGTNLSTILAGLRHAAGPETVIAVMTYYNPLPACDLATRAPLASLVLEGGRAVPWGLNDIIRERAAVYGVVVAEPGPLIDVDDLVGGPDCLHPDASGHDDIAAAFDAVIEASQVIRPG